MSTSPEEPQEPAQDPGDQAAEQNAETETPLTAEEILDAEQTEEARAADHEGAGATGSAGTEFAQLAEDRLEDLRRLQAEFVNYKNRTDRERAALRDHVISDVLGSVVPVFDDIDAARAAGDLEEGPFAAIAAKLEDLLGKQGLERIGRIGEAFDPNVHEAVLQQPADGVDADHISMVLRSGFRVGTRVVRPAQVAVAP
ncbi:nucleotide exchange factor GrpE [Kocuria coralli]|uniref:Protein GrpE n=1 Tax=Kocuria coralli TaxID=1461025 RepID=A0A5J5L189_9MICC|nr:nucleotide exchange factor GrpE [Kocuria coralli]KAA9395348.1 nucleotide exchange factor GrpE [Kocuria coralli]